MVYEIMKISSVEYHNYNTPGFNSFTRYRMEKIVEKLKNGINVFNIDTDVVIFGDESYFVDKLVEPLDVIAQQEHDGNFCTGFMLIRSNTETINFFSHVSTKIDRLSNDQDIANRLWKTKQFNLNVGFFEPQDVTSYGIISGGKQWNGQEFDLPNCKAFHANYTIGLQKKQKLIDYVKSKRVA